MTKQTSPAKALCRQIALVPLSVAAIFMFSTNIIAQETTNIIKPQQKEIQSTKEGVSQAMLDEYERIIIKNKLNAESVHATPPPAISDADKSRLETIFLAMSEAQQAKQAVTFEPSVPLSANKPTKEQFRSFKNRKNYAITIDDKKVDNADLNNYQPPDFLHCDIIYLAKTNSNYGKHLPIDVYLMTREYYKTYVKKFLVEHKDYIMIAELVKKVGQK